MEARRWEAVVVSRALALSALPPDVQAKLLKGGKKRSAEPTRVALFLAALADQGLPKPVREFRFAPNRKFRADFAWPAWLLLCEMEGGVFTRQAHGSITGLLRDIEKYNLAATLGYRVIRCVPKDLTSDAFLATIRAALTWHQP